MSDDTNKPAGDGKPRRRRRRRRRPSGAAPTREGERAPREGERAPREGERPARNSERPARDSGRAAPEGDAAQKKRRRRRRKPREDQPAERSRPARASQPPPPAQTDDVDLGWDDEPPAVPEPRPAPAPVAADDDHDDHDDPHDEVNTSIRYGDDADAPTPEVVLTADLPAGPAADDDDPTSAALWDEPEPAAGQVANVIGIKFATAGKIYRYDAGDAVYQRGEQVMVESDRGPRVGTVAVPPRRRPHTGAALKRVLRRPGAGDRRTLERNASDEQSAIRAAREAVRKANLEMKVFRAELSHSGKKLRLYFTSEDRIDFRDLARDLSRDLHTRVEMRQIGVRDQAKMLGGIGSCGMELCCSTWLPEFAPVSIKNAKDQGLVLNPTKVSGQCGRLKCCLVYEQALYAEMRKGLPKLGKRVVTEIGEGRVVEVDVLRQRVRVSHVTGDIALFGAGEVKPMFPSQQPQQKKKAKPSEPPSDPTPEE